ncbi:patatin-like phospholipase family protein [Persicobacter psychrovividus]|uniref:Serine protease n=1 Tax=Persicobacter psychrovividus TaxID=387638 RepID=A0ABN6LA69_9BACT|nr:serine protease [Persicobacter psychrovividus]
MSKNVALVLGSGGARGLAHIGVLEALLDHGFNITSIAGSSIGAVIGGCYARGKMREGKAWFAALDKFDLFNLIDFTFSKQGLVKGDRLFDNLKEIIGDKLIDDLYIPYIAVATDIQQNKEVVFRHGSLLTAMRASVAIPSFITPFFYHGRELIDGGVTNPLPINRIHRFPKDICIAVDINANIPYTPVISQSLPPQELFGSDSYEKNMRSFISFFNKTADKKVVKMAETIGFLDIINRSFDIMQDQISAHIIQTHPPDVLIQVSRKACGTLDFYKIDEMIAHGREATEKALREKKLI